MEMWTTVFSVSWSLTICTHGRNPAANKRSVLVHLMLHLFCFVPWTLGYLLLLFLQCINVGDRLYYLATQNPIYIRMFIWPLLSTSKYHRCKNPQVVSSQVAIIEQKKCVYISVVWNLFAFDFLPHNGSLSKAQKQTALIACRIRLKTFKILSEYICYL